MPSEKLCVEETCFGRGGYHTSGCPLYGLARVEGTSGVRLDQVLFPLSDTSVSQAYELGRYDGVVSARAWLLARGLGELADAFAAERFKPYEDAGRRRGWAP